MFYVNFEIWDHVEVGQVEYFAKNLVSELKFFPLQTYNIAQTSFISVLVELA